jgi:D-alanyl-lipoteichoic acid acyltransferase DltB (MBOAT superfamily)
MNPTSFEFALFFLLVLPLNWLLRPYDFAYRIFLLAASYVFYASFNLKFVLIIFTFSFLTWFSPSFSARLRTDGSGSSA